VSTTVLRLETPRGFEAVSLDGTRIVRCLHCDQQWRVPKRMDRLSHNAWYLLHEHAAGHWPVKRRWQVRLRS